MDEIQHRASTFNYYGCTKKHSKALLYDRLFRESDGYESKRHRDDRMSTFKLDVGAEEKERTIPVRSNSYFGKYIETSLVRDTAEKKHKREAVIADMDFYRANGANIPFGGKLQ
ncbi:cilia- and flagella-associated protein 90-like [Ptychodera flava]|uniref:cilia- and flagella-associated protein 90-like n=1 Tax=Ptychodera flava TaxID=63121 RepID=UPI003969FA9F